MNVVPLPLPYTNCSFTIQFHGPSIKCASANNTQQQIFDELSMADRNKRITPLAASRSNVTYPAQSESIILETAVMSLFSAFTSFACYVDRSQPQNLSVGVNQLNNWHPSVSWEGVYNFNSTQGPTIVRGGPMDSDESINRQVQELWVQTSNQSLVCSLGNASYEVDFNFTNGVQTVTRNQVEDFEPLLLPTPDYYLLNSVDYIAYMATFLSLANSINGNVSMQLIANDDSESSSFTLIEMSSKILLGGLVACEDFTNNFWAENYIVFQDTQGTLFWSNSTWASEEFPRAYYNITNKLFTKPPWMCRNRTLARAMEDLFANITVGMLCSPNLTNSQGDTVNVTYLENRNLYQYDNQNLLISYSIASFITNLCVSIGIYAFHENGVAHSTAFSALVATTRNTDLDALSKGHSLGSLPLDKKIAKTKLKFGELRGKVVGEEAKGMAGIMREVEVGHLGFGFEDRVVGLRKGGVYV